MGMASSICLCVCHADDAGVLGGPGQRLCCALFRAVWLKLGSKRLLWERMRAFFYPYALMPMRQLFEALLYGFKRSSPLVPMDSS